MKGLKQSVRRLGSNGEEKSGSISTRLPLPLNRTQSIRRDPHPIIAAHREIISYCFENAHSDIGHRILMRLFEKRTDFQKFIFAYGKDKWMCITMRLKDYLEDVVLNLESMDIVERLSKKYGEEHVELKSYGFKPDFWVSLADAITVECVILDQANHAPTDTVAAWSQLVSIMFTSIRDGYYNALRALRINSRKSLRRQATVESTNAKEQENIDETKPAPLVLNNTRVTYSMSCISPINGNFNTFHKSDSPIRLESPIFE
uniref:Globin family profile domain-containing protein n=1 Tax=Acrobeloides nanus TaxID=290746 RepID=A0A914BYN9_9BILA